MISSKPYNRELLVSSLSQSLKEIRLSIFAIEQSIKTSPSGSLRMSKEKEGVFRYYRIRKKGDTVGTYINSSEKALINKLAQKGYDIKVLRELKAEEKQIETLLKLLNENNPAKVYEKLSLSRMQLVMPFDKLQKELIIKHWKQQSVETQPFGEYESVITNKKGVRVKSKSERMLSDAFDDYGIPYIYGPKHIVEGRTYYLDFKLLNPRTLDEYAHEHFGMMDDANYIGRNIQKLRAYMRNGFVLGKNFLITMETSQAPLNYDEVRYMIEQYLL